MKMLVMNLWLRWNRWARDRHRMMPGHEEDRVCERCLWPWPCKWWVRRNERLERAEA